MSASKKELQAHAAERSGHSARLREALKASRERQGWSARFVAERIAQILTLQDRLLDPEAEDHRPKHENTIYMWERFENHPNIADFAAWARALGYRLVVDLDDSSDARTMVLLETKEAVELARMVDTWPEVRRQALMTLVDSMLPTAGE